MTATLTFFDSTKEFLSDLLRELSDGQLQLPDFQRGWVWDDDHIRRVLASVARSYPIVPSCCSRPAVRRGSSPDRSRAWSFRPGGQPEPKRLILDGQQRLTKADISPEEMDGILLSHAIDPDTLHNDNFVAFFRGQADLASHSDR
jgi:hypothetical protein